MFDVITLKDGAIEVDNLDEDFFGEKQENGHRLIWKLLKGEKGDLKKPYNITVLYDSAEIGQSIKSEDRAYKIAISEDGKVEVSKVN